MNQATVLGAITAKDFQLIKWNKLCRIELKMVHATHASLIFTVINLIIMM